MRRIELDSGKYTVINELSEGDGFYALRHGEEWKSLAGDNVALYMFLEIERLRSFISGKPSNCVDCGDYFMADFEREEGLYYCEGCDH